MSGVFREGLLEGKAAFVTGGGSGIGAAIAQRFAEHGAKVAVLGRRKEKLDDVVKRIEGAGGTALACPADVRQYADVEGGVRAAVEAFGRLDVLVCSAAGNFPAPAVGMSANGFKSVIDIDLLGTFNACRASFDALARQGGSIVSITATQAWVPTPLQAHVGAAKAGIAKLTQDLALEWGAARIRVNAVAPGPIADTEGMRRLAPQDSDASDRMQRTLPVGRWGRVDEVVDAVLYLVSPAADFITGTTLVVDGGQSLVGAGAFQRLFG